MLPEFSVGPFVSLPTYFIYLSLLSSLWLYLVWLWAGRSHERQDVAVNVAMLVLIFGLMGGRLMHVLYEAPEFYKHYPSDAFKLWRGGYVFFGGFFASLLAVFVYLRRQKESFLKWFDFFAPLLALGYGLGRGACLLAGCCYGGYCDLPWAISGRHPTQTYAMLIELFFAYVLFRRANLVNQKKREPLQAGSIALMWICLHSLGRLLMENFRDDFRGDLIAGLSISMWISLVLFSFSAAGLFTILILPKLGGKKT